MASPQDNERTNTSRFEPYITDVVSKFKADSRVLWWGIFNEPHRSGFSLELRHTAFGWAKAIDPSQVGSDDRPAHVPCTARCADHPGSKTSALGPPGHRSR